MDLEGQAEGRGRQRRLTPHLTALVVLVVAVAVAALAAGFAEWRAPAAWGSVVDDGTRLPAWAVASMGREDDRDMGFSAVVVDPRSNLIALVYDAGSDDAGCMWLPRSVEAAGDTLRLSVGRWRQGPLATRARTCGAEQPTDVAAVTLKNDAVVEGEVVDGECLARGGVREACLRPVRVGTIARTGALP